MKKVLVVLALVLTILIFGKVAMWKFANRPGTPVQTSTLPFVEAQPSAPELTATREPVLEPVAPVQEVRAFPEAEGFGANAVGGRGGQVIEVTNLFSGGEGSLRACVNAKGPRICIFRVAGTIELKSTLEIRNPYLTIAGQSAPGGGITLKMADPTQNEDILKISTYEVIIRYIRSRPGTKADNARALTINANRHSGDDAEPAYNIVIDHNSFSWAGDEVLIAWDKTHHVTFQWNIIAESLPPGLKGPNLGSSGGGYYSFHHNLVAHHAYRVPNVSASGGPTDLVNNVIYNFRRYGSRVLLGGRVNIVNNYIKAGPDTLAPAYYVRDDLDVVEPGLENLLPNSGSQGFYSSGNMIDGSYDGTLRIESVLPPDTRRNDVKSKPYTTPPITTTTAERAYQEVLSGAGAVRGLNCDGTWFARPDAVDSRIVASVLNNRSSSNTPAIRTGYISDPSEVGGWPSLDPGQPCPDADQDGMPDEWEIAQGFNPNRDDSAMVMPDGYTRLEHYLNGTN